MKTELINLLSTINLQYQYRHIEKFHPDLFKWIVDSTLQYNPSSLIESIYIILNGPPSSQCQYNISNNMKFIGFSKGYSKFCSGMCQCLTDFKRTKLGRLSDEDRVNRLKKRSNTNLEKYGVEYPSQSLVFKDKAKQTTLEKYGFEHVSLVPEIREKAKQTHINRHGNISKIGTDAVQEKIKQINIEKLGVEYPLQSAEIREKSKQTILKKYGVENPQQLTEIREKSKQTKLERYGTEHPQKLEKIKDKITSTNLTRYGVKYPSQSDEIREKSKQTSLKKYGVENPSQSNKVKEKIKQINLVKYGVEYKSQSHMSKSTIDILNDRQLFTEVITGKTIKEVTSILSISVTTVLVYSRKYNVYDLLDTASSSYELLVEKLLTKLSIGYIRNTRSIIKPLELDFYIPDYNLAIEVGSLYFHNENTGGKDKFYHYNKWKQCNDQNITLLQYFDNDLLQHWNIVESKIKRLCKIQAPIVGSRKLNICDLKDYNTERVFLSTYHLQGATSKRSIVIGAYYNDELVAISTWLIKDNVAELVRYVTNINYSYPGLFSRMLVKFKTLTNFKGKLFSFSDNRHSNGNLYRTSGFNLEYITKPGYTYSSNGCISESRLRYQKHKLEKLFDLDDNYIKSHTEWEIMQEMGYDRLWDAGQSKWTMTI